MLGVVLLIVFGALRIGTRAWEKGEKDTNIHQRQRAVMALLSQQIASAAVYEIKVGGDDFYFRGSQEKMEFVSRSPIVPGALTGMVYVRYEILEADEKGRKQLKFYEKDAGFLEEEDLKDQTAEDLLPLISGVANLQFEYLKKEDEDTVWQTSWEASETKEMPEAVKIMLTQDDRSAPVTLIVPIHCQKG